MAKAAKAVGSVRLDAFEIRFNPDCFCTTVQHGKSENLQKQRSLVAQAAEFLLVQVRPHMQKSCCPQIKKMTFEWLSNEKIAPEVSEIHNMLCAMTVLKGSFDGLW